VVERLDPTSPFGDVEAMVRAAGGYVQASSDLRPRVVEAARLQRREIRARRTIRRLAVAAVLFAALTAAVGHQAQTASRNGGLTLLGADSHAMYSRAEVHSSAAGGVSWGIVEAFRELRELQTDALRPEQ
jgi:hypothetical protein